MAIHYTPTNIHWNYFLALEQDFERTSRYVEFAAANNDTYSVEFARLIMSASQEVDVILKELCRQQGVQNVSSINSYQPIITQHYPDLNNEWVYLHRFGMKSQPWDTWLPNTSPLWWDANNGIKHNRLNEFSKATLINAFNALGALLVVTAYFYKEDQRAQGKNVGWEDVMSILKPEASIFSLNDDYYYSEVVGGKHGW